MTIRRPLLAPIAALACAGLVLAGCGTNEPETKAAPPTTDCPAEPREPDPGCPTATTPTAAPPTSAAPAPTGPSATAPDGPPDLPPPANPAAPAVIVTPGEDVPNPMVLVEDRYYMYATQVFWKGSLAHVPVRASTDLRHWTIVADALPRLPDWVEPGATWAPDVRRVATGYVLYFTARVNGLRPVKQCIGIATGTSPTGPFEPARDPFICQLDRGGSIDPRTFAASDGSLWLHWKSDDNSDVNGSARTSIYAQQLTPDGLGFAGPPKRILEADQRWEGRIVEAPHLFLHGGKHWLFYSGNWFNQPDYAIGIAECDGPAGPCRKRPGPWLRSNTQGRGPGEGSLFVDKGGRTFLVYAPFGQRYRTYTVRPVALVRVGWNEQGPYLGAT